MTKATVDQADFTVVYDGEALRGHRMDVRDLAPALLGLAEVFQNAHAALSPGEPPVSLEIRATDEGSFMVELSLIHREVVDVLVSRDALAASALIAFIGGAKGLLSFATKRRRAAEVAALPDGSVRFTMPNGTVIEYGPQISTLAKDPGVRHGIQAAVRPLSQSGIDTMDVRATAESEPWVTITDEEIAGIAEALADEDEQPPLVDTQYEQLLTVLAPSFQRGNKWRVRDAPHQTPFWVAMDDQGFFGEVLAHRVVFGANDRLLARVWLRQWERLGEIQTERSVLHVIRHIPAKTSVQEAMFGTDGAPTDL